MSDWPYWRSKCGYHDLITLRPWLHIYRMPYRGSLPRRMICEVCNVDYRNQGLRTAAKFLLRHRRCGPLLYTYRRTGGDS